MALLKRLLIVAVGVLAVFWIAYVGIVNVVLNLPATQDYVNRLNPDQLLIRWDRAWSIVPFRVHATGFTVNAQPWQVQLSATVPDISATVAILPLFSQTVHLTGIDTRDIDFRLRPRIDPKVNDALLRPFYPVIEGRDPNLEIGPVPVPEPGWKLVFDVAQLAGEHEVWLAPVKMKLTGETAFSVTIANPNGPLTVSGGTADASVVSLIAAGIEVAKSGTVAGTYSIGPFLPQENTGPKFLGFLSVDADIDLPLGDAAFISYFIESVSGLKVRGGGGVKGHLTYRNGFAVPGTQLEIAAQDLAVDLAPYSVRGTGAVAISVDAARPDTMNAEVTFGTLGAFVDPGSQTLFTGTDLKLSVERTTLALPGARIEEVPRSVALTMTDVTVPDVRVFQRYLPDKWHAEVLSGTGALNGRAALSANALDFDVTLRSEGAAVKLMTDAFETGLLFHLKAKGDAATGTGKIDFSGTSIALDDSQVKTAAGVTTPRWATSLTATKGEISFGLTNQDASAGLVGFWSIFRTEDLKTLLGAVDGEMTADLTVSDLGWLNLFFKNPVSLALSNTPEIDVNLVVRSGFLAEGTTVKSVPRGFRLEVLDYVAEGTGGFTLSVARGGANPDLRLDAALDKGSLRLDSEKTAAISDVTLSVSATAEGVSLAKGGTARAVELTVPSATVTDMATYNAYLPKGSPVRLLGGAGGLSAKLTMTETTASGFVNLETSRVSADVDGVRMSGVINADVVIKGGSAKDKRFDITGSSIAVSRVRLAGSQAANWGARLDLGRSDVIWKAPMTLNLSASLAMTDARPVLAVFESHRKTNKWLDNILDLKNIRAQASLRVTPDRIVIPRAYATSDTIALGAKGIFRPNSREGMFYARYGALAGILVFNGAQKRFEAFGATGKFNAYSPGDALPLPQRAARGSSAKPRPGLLGRQ